ncbi:MAG TPA: hypothetical protein VKO67_07450 [Smithellaceae bacterium]|nr:hypothetical protein [Smithellaceae bacterium]
MRKVWIVCGWVVIIAGIILIIAMGLAWIGGAEISKALPAVIMGGLFIVSGWNFIVRGKQLPPYSPSEDPGAAGLDHTRTRQMVMQAIRMGSIIILGVASIVGLLIFFSTYLKKP